MPMLKRLCTRLTKPAAFTVLLLTVPTVLVAFSELAGNFARREHRPEFENFVSGNTFWGFWLLHIPGLLLPACISAWLLYQASTQYLRRVAMYAALIWAQQTITMLMEVQCCGGYLMSTRFWFLHFLVFLPFVLVVIFSFKLALARVAVLEASALQPMGAATLRRLLCIGAVSGLAAVALNAWGTPIRGTFSNMVRHERV